MKPSGTACRKCIRRSPCLPAACGCGASWRSRGPATWSPSATWTRATGRPISPAARASATRCCSVILLSNLMAILLQALAARLGIATGRDLAQACRDHYSQPVNIALWLACEVGDHRVRSCRGHRHGDRTAVALRHSADRGRPHHRARRLPPPAPDESRLPLPRSVRDRAPGRDRGVLRRADRRRRAAGRGRAARLRAVAVDRDQSRDAVCGDRHHRRDRDAAQSVPAFVDRADPRLSMPAKPGAATRSAGPPPTAPSR